MANTALITGASSGIGREIVRIHCAQGGDAVITSIEEEPLTELKKELERKYPVKVSVLIADLTKQDAPTQIYNEIKKRHIQIDYLVNNAGFGGSGPFHLGDWKRDRDMIQLNIVAVSMLTRLFLPEFVQRNQGRILNVSSLASLMPGPYMAVYYATKAYVTSFSNALAEELRGTEVTVTALLPGATDTDFGKTAGIANTPIFRKTASVRKVARAGYDGMLKGKLNVLAGLTTSQQILTPLIPLTPRRLLLKIIRKLHEVKRK